MASVSKYWINSPKLAHDIIVKAKQPSSTKNPCYSDNNPTTTNNAPNSLLYVLANADNRA